MSGDEHGFALAFTLIVLAAITAGTIAVTQLSVSATRHGRTVERQHRGDLAAEGIAEVMADLVAQAPETATSMPSFVANFDGLAAAASAEFDVSSGVWTITGTAVGRVVTERYRRIDGRLTRFDWSTGL